MKSCCGDTLYWECDGGVRDRPVPEMGSVQGKIGISRHRE